MGKAVEVYVLCNNRLLRESITRILTKDHRFVVSAAHPITPDTGREVAAANPDVIVLDSLQFILDHHLCLKKADDVSRYPKCVLIAMEDDPTQFLMAVRRGALGFVLQDASAEDVSAAVHAVGRGEAICPPRMAKLLFDFVATQTSDLPSSRVRNRLGLTRREQQFIPFIRQGMTNKEIAAQLSLSEQTVKNHIHRILKKVGVKDRLEVAEAFQIQTLGA